MNAAPRPAGATDIELPNPARVHDALLNGTHNFGADRRLARQLAAAAPGFARGVVAERRFLHRAIRCCAEAGIRQILDLGWGIPTVGNAYQAVQHTTADARVVCVDLDPIAVALTHDVLKGDQRAAAIQADLRHPARILNHPAVTALLNFEQPVAVLLVSVLHHLDDHDDPWAITAQLRDRLTAGSALIISHLNADSQPQEIARVRDLVEPAGLHLTPRTRGQIQHLFHGVDLVHPGLVWAPHWRPDQAHDADLPPGAPSSVLAGVGHHQ